MNVSVVGISHHTASVEAREAFALPGESAGRLLVALRADPVFDEAMVLDTCNRTEVYYVAADGMAAVRALLEQIARLKGGAIADASAVFQYHGRDAVAHLFRVAAALDSQIVGEHQILGQVKNAYRLACEHRTSQFFLNKLLHWAFRVGKRAQTESNLGRGSASVAQAAVTLSMQVFSTLKGKGVMLVGAGQTGALAAKALVRCGVGDVIVANRTVAKARELAEQVVRFGPEDAEQLDLDENTIACPALRQMLRELREAPDASETDRPMTRAIGLDELPDVIGEVDLVISATGSPEVVLTAEALAKPIGRGGRSLVMVDIAVPRDIDPALGERDDVFLYNIDDLDRIVAQDLKSRRAEIPRVEAICSDELSRFARWHDSLQVTPTIKLLKQRLARLQDAELRRFASKLDPQAAEQAQHLSRSLCNKILHQPIAYLRGLSETAGPSDTLAAADMIRTMFQLDELEDHA